MSSPAVNVISFEENADCDKLNSETFDLNNDSDIAFGTLDFSNNSFADVKINERDCTIPDCDCNIVEEALLQKNLERYNVDNTLRSLLNDTHTIHEWEMSISRPLEKCVTFTTYIAHKLSRQEIIYYTDVLNKCECCSRHTGCDDLPDLPKCANCIGQHEEPNACKCNCRHQLRKLSSALVIALY